MIFYTYLHKTADTNRIFYIGKGVNDRYRVYTGRNKYWSSLVAKHGIIPEIIAYWSTEKEAYDHEMFLITCFKDMGYRLANMSTGGEGGGTGTKQNINSNFKRSESLKKFYSNPANRQKSKEHLDSLRLNKEIQEKRIQAVKDSFLKPNLKRRANLERMWSDATLQLKRREKMKESWADPEKKAKRLVNRKSGADSHSAKQIRCIDTGVIFEWMGGAINWLRELGFKNAEWSAISSVCSGRRKTAYTYHWEYV